MKISYKTRIYFKNNKGKIVKYNNKKKSLKGYVSVNGETFEFVPELKKMKGRKAVQIYKDDIKQKYIDYYERTGKKVNLKKEKVEYKLNKKVFKISKELRKRKKYDYEFYSYRSRSSVRQLDILNGFNFDRLTKKKDFKIELTLRFKRNKNVNEKVFKKVILDKKRFMKLKKKTKGFNLWVAGALMWDLRKVVQKLDRYGWHFSSNKFRKSEGDRDLRTMRAFDIDIKVVKTKK